MTKSQLEIAIGDALTTPEKMYSQTNIFYNYGRDIK